MSQSVAGELELARTALADEYDVLDEIGRGGMAIVFRARDKALDRDVAIKMLPPTLAFDAAFVERFQHEARTAAQLEHPNIVPIYRVGVAGTQPSQVIYFVMKQLRGESLASMLAARGTLPPDEIRAVLQDTAQALSYASRRGVVHRDIKPDNILWDDDRWVLADFGIAKSAAGRSLTQSGASVGTPRYMSPEQARAKPLDVRADIYSLGIVAYQCLVGHVPFDGDDGFAILYEHVTSPLPTPPLANDEERALYAIIGRMTEKHLDDRVQDGDALLRLLDVPPRPTPTLVGVIPGVVLSTTPTATAVPIVTSPTLRAITEGPTMPLLPPEIPTAPIMVPGAFRWPPRRWIRWTIEVAALAAGLGVLASQRQRPSVAPAPGAPVAAVPTPGLATPTNSATGPATTPTTPTLTAPARTLGAGPRASVASAAPSAPSTTPPTRGIAAPASGTSTPGNPALTAAASAPSPAADAPATPAATPAPATPAATHPAPAGKSRCGATFRLLVDSIPTRVRGTPFDLRYDVCGLDAGAPYKLVVTTHRHAGGISKLLGGAGISSETLDERATGQLSHRRIRFTSFADLKPGDYSLLVKVTDHRGRTREHTQVFTVLDHRD